MWNRSSLDFLPGLIDLVDLGCFMRIWNTSIGHLLLLHIAVSGLVVDLLYLVDNGLIAKICLVAVVSAHVDCTFSESLSIGTTRGLVLLGAHLLVERLECGVVRVLEDSSDVEFLRLQGLELLRVWIGWHLRFRCGAVRSKWLYLEAIVVLNLHLEETVSVRELAIVIG